MDNKNANCQTPSIVEWTSVQDRLPIQTGWYKIKTPYGEYEAALSRTLSGKLAWVIPDASIITHWANK